MSISNNIRLIGLSGTNGAGKDSAGDLLQRKFGYTFVSVSDFLREEASRRDLPHERKFLSQISREWRSKLGEGALVLKVIEGMDATQPNPLVISSIRAKGEVETLHEHGGVVLWIDADPRLRYERITRNSRGRTEDNKTFEEFLNEEKIEMEGLPGSQGLCMQDVKNSSDFIIDNSNSMAELEEGLKKVLSK